MPSLTECEHSAGRGTLGGRVGPPLLSSSSGSSLGSVPHTTHAAAAQWPRVVCGGVSTKQQAPPATLHSPTKGLSPTQGTWGKDSLL